MESIKCECGGKYTDNNKIHHNKTKKHQSFISNKKESVISEESTLKMPYDIPLYTPYYMNIPIHKKSKDGENTYSMPSLTQANGMINITVPDDIENIKSINKDGIETYTFNMKINGLSFALKYVPK